VGPLAERVRFEVARVQYGHGDQSFNITVSIGIACVRHAKHIDLVLREVDTALYQAKQTKNTVSLAAS
jgi:PleD family two-component response regulator